MVQDIKGIIRNRKGTDNTISNRKRDYIWSTIHAKQMTENYKMRKHELHKNKNGSELRFVGCVSCFCSINDICYKSREERMGLLPRQYEHYHDQF